jgi:GTP-binding protein
MKVCIIGRTNVGKSTLFNRLIDQQKAIISKIAGTTRDRNYMKCFWRGKTFELIDTGGLQKIEMDEIEKKVQLQTQIAIKEADLILFVVDVREGMLFEDKEIAKNLRKSKKAVILIVNKVDSNNLRKLTSDFFKLGLGEPILVSAVTGIGTGDLLDEIVKKIFVLPTVQLDENNESLTKKSVTKIILVGRPNVGKSSILNAILGEERVIVSEQPHTTREVLDTLIIYKNQPIVIIDTVGLRKKKQNRFLYRKNWNITKSANV